MEDTIKVEITNIDKYYEDVEDDFLRYFYGQKTILRHLIPFLIGLCLLIGGLLSGYDIKTATLIDGNEEIIYRNYHAAIGVGLGIMTYYFFIISRILKSKKVTKTFFNTKQRKLENIAFYISNEHLKLSTNLEERILQWEYFRSYEITNSRIKLFGHDNALEYPDLFIPLEYFDVNQLKSVKNILVEKIKNS